MRIDEDVLEVLFKIAFTGALAIFILALLLIHSLVGGN